MENRRSLRNVGGTRNPFTLAELIEGKKIDWDCMTPLQMRQKFQQVFRKPYEKLFSPQYDSPLYKRKFSVRRRS
jgi:hypothetical protein